MRTAMKSILALGILSTLMVSSAFLPDACMVRAGEGSEVWKLGDKELAQDRYKEARDLFLEALAAYGREGRYPGFLLHRLGRAEEGLGNRKAAWNYYLRALENPWEGPAGEAGLRGTVTEKLVNLTPAGVSMKPYLKARGSYMEHLAGLDRFKDPLISLAALNRRLTLDPGNDPLRRDRAAQQGQWLREELLWQLQKPQRLPVRKGLKGWTWRGHRPRVVGGARACLEAESGSTTYFYTMTDVEGSFAFEADLRRKGKTAPGAWGFVFGDSLDGERRHRVQVIRDRAAWTRLKPKKEWALVDSASTDPTLLTDRWQRFALHHDALVNRVRVFLGDRVVADMKGADFLLSGKLGVFVQDGVLEVRKAILAVEETPD